MVGIHKEMHIFEMNQQYTGKSIVDDLTQPTTSSFHTGADNTHLTLRMGIRERTQYVYFARGSQSEQVQCDYRSKREIRQDGLYFNCLARHKVSCCSSRQCLF